MAKYIKQEMPDMNKTGKTKAFYRMKILRNMGTNELVKLMVAHRAGVSEGVIKAVLIQLAEEMAYQMAEGYSITIDEIGTFNATVGVRKDKKMDEIDGDKPKRNALSLEVNGINFKADKRLIRRTDRQCTLERGGVQKLHRSKYSKEERLTLAQQYLDNHAVMRIADYVRITGLSRTTATLELQEFRRNPNSGITISGSRQNSVYIKGGSDEGLC